MFALNNLFTFYISILIQLPLIKKKCLVKQIPYLFLQLNVSVKQFLLLNNPSYLFKQSMYINFMTLIITLYCTGKNIIITSLTLPFYSYSGTINDLLLVISRVGNFYLAWEDVHRKWSKCCDQRSSQVTSVPTSCQLSGSH